MGAALVVLQIGCGDEPPPLVRCPIGDLAAPAELEIVHLDAQNAVIQTQAMAQVPLIAPPQGGWIVLLGARARNVDGCQLNIAAALIDGCNNQIIQIDRRPTQLELGADGWGVSSPIAFANLPVCPQLTATRDLRDVPYTVQVLVEDIDGKSASASLTVVPTCPADARCACECDRDYMTGQQCTGTGGPHTTCPP